jgi:hypothetical protein
MLPAQSQAAFRPVSVGQFDVGPFVAGDEVVAGSEAGAQVGAGRAAVEAPVVEPLAAQKRSTAPALTSV